MKQPSFADLAYDNKKKITRKERFLGEMDSVLPWSNKSEFYRWCRKIRFKGFSNLVNKYRPKIVICAQLTAQSYYEDAFDLSGGKWVPKDSLSGGSMIHYSRNGTNFFVVPALSGGGRGCLTSYETIEVFGKAIRQISGFR